MTLWTVKLELVPNEGTPPLSDADVNSAADTIRSRFSENEAAASGRSDRLVVSAKVEAEDAGRAEAWGRANLYDVATDLLVGWRLDRIVSWHA
jgi:hypothetical protein